VQRTTTENVIKKKGRGQGFTVSGEMPAEKKENLFEKWGPLVGWKRPRAKGGLKKARGFKYQQGNAERE